MDTQQVLSWAVAIIGLTGFYLAGKKVWWCWYINIFCQILWLAYAFVSYQLAFVVTALVYSVVFTNNAINWTREHFNKKAEADQGLYRTKSVPIDARYFSGGLESAESIIYWLSENGHQAWWKEEAASRMDPHGRFVKEMPETLRVLDREGTLDISPGEYVVLGSSDSVYVFQAEAFESAYERVEYPK